MEMRLERLGTTLVAKLNGELDHSCAAEIRERLDKEISTGGMKNLVMDFDMVDFMDSSGIGLVMGRYRALSKTGAELVISETPPQIYKVMKLAGLERLARLESR